MVCILLLVVISALRAGGVDYVEDYFDQRVDHFNLEKYDQTFRQRYLYNDKLWDSQNGPIFFYLGNEGNIVDLWKGNGFVRQAAKRFRALVIYAEHRYYGESLPFGNESFNHGKIGQLSIEQALVDYAFFITNFKKQWKIQNRPVVAFGGSYGGMLSAYMRFKYPNVIIGSIAASAPLYQAAGLTSGDLFFQSVTRDFNYCIPNVRLAYAQLKEWSTMGRAGLKKISDVFRLCKPLQSEEDYTHLLLWSRNAFVMAAMVDYPYPLGNLPAYPVDVMCHQLRSNDLPEVGLAAAVALYYNSSGTSKCFDIHEEYINCSDPTGCGLGSDSKAWDYQACTQVNLEGSTGGTVDMFPVLPFTSEMRDEYCLRTWGVTPRRDVLNVELWGEDISSASNIVFSNGDLDPWAQGGILSDVSDTLVTVIIRGGAHHLDLRDDNPNDPPSVREAREFEMQHITKWLEQYYNNTSTDF